MSYYRPRYRYDRYGRRRATRWSASYGSRRGYVYKSRCGYYSEPIYRRGAGNTSASINDVLYLVDTLSSKLDSHNNIMIRMNNDQTVLLKSVLDTLHSILALLRTHIERTEGYPKPYIARSRRYRSSGRAQHRYSRSGRSNGGGYKAEREVEGEELGDLYYGI